MFQTSVLASGSKGNSVLIRTEITTILLDAGLSGKKLLNLMESINIASNEITAIIISHEHSDHIQGAGILCRKLNIPLYITELTHSVCSFKIGKLPGGKKYFEIGTEFQIGNIRIKAFPSSHDVIDGSNFVFWKVEDEKRKLAVATDLGYSSRLMLHNLQDCTSIILESNHDVEMLLNGPYPPHLKQRIKSNQGHLSNAQAVGVITHVLHPELKNLVLAHLSEKNNLPQMAESLMSNYLKNVNHNSKLLVATQTEATVLLDI